MAKKKKITESKRKWAEAAKERFITVKIFRVAVPLIDKLRDYYEHEDPLGERPTRAKVIYDLAKAELEMLGMK